MNRLSHSLAAALSLMIVTCTGSAEPALPKLSPAEGLGVNIHFTDPMPGEMEMIAAAGFKWVRMDFSWDRMEKVKGQYDFSDYDRLLAALDKQKMHAILIFDYGNPLYQTGPNPNATPEFRDAFSKWAAAAVKHFAGRGCVWEMWNEPNGNFWKPKANVADYIVLAKATASAVHEAAPDEPIIGPATSTIDFRFLEACFRGGLLEDWAGVSVHPYRQSDPATVAADYQRLRDLIAKFAPQGKTIPIISGEWGYSTVWPNFDEAKQARYLTTEFMTNIANNIPISIWYDWRDDGVNPKDPEHHFGLVRREYHQGRDPVYDPKPAYEAMKELAGKLN